MSIDRHKDKPLDVLNVEIKSSTQIIASDSKNHFEILLSSKGLVIIDKNNLVIGLEGLPEKPTIEFLIYWYTSSDEYYIRDRIFTEDIYSSEYLINLRDFFRRLILVIFPVNEDFDAGVQKIPGLVYAQNC